MSRPIKQNVSIYIVGAGLAGTMIAHEISEKNIFGKVAAFLVFTLNPIRSTYI